MHDQSYHIKNSLVLLNSARVHPINQLHLATHFATLSRKWNKPSLLRSCRGPDPNRLRRCDLRPGPDRKDRIATSETGIRPLSHEATLVARPRGYQGSATRQRAFFPNYQTRAAW